VSKGVVLLDGAPPVVRPREPRVQAANRYEGIRQYSLARILGLWAAAAVPMGVLAWLVAPWLGDRIGGREPLAKGLLICFNVGLLWILALTLVLIKREQGSLAWSRVRHSLWILSPRDPKTGRVGGKVWWWVVPFTLLFLALTAAPIDPKGPIPRDLPRLISEHKVRAEHFFHGAWGWFALAVMVALLSPVVEELFFRGLLLPRMRKVFGKRDWVLNGAMFAGYHVHQPWSMPAALLTGVFTHAYPTKRFQSIWIAVITHTLPSFVIIAVILSLVL